MRKEIMYFAPPYEIKRVLGFMKDPHKLCEILSDIFRINTLSMIMEAGSGHPGTCLSVMDILTWLWVKEMRNPNAGLKDSDTFFSSKGHDAPALYSVLIGLGKLDREYIHKLRRLGGLPGHPDIKTPYIAANTGSLGMGISKARGMAIANRLKGNNGRIFVVTGDGELQEGQIWEALHPVANERLHEITVIVDHNKIQTDNFVASISDLGNLMDKFSSFGWDVFRCDGHNFLELEWALNYNSGTIRPKIIIADTVKGKGVSFMEKMDEDGLYKYHSGALGYEEYVSAINQIYIRLSELFTNQRQIFLVHLDHPPYKDPKSKDTKSALSSITHAKVEKLVLAYEDELAIIGGKREDIVVLDADLEADTGVLKFKKAFPERFLQCGIAEQDMVSVAGGLALKGMLPICHSFANFISSRANEQIYNNATEKTKIIYVGTLAGVLPGGPGHSHQAVRDISSLAAVPGLTMIEPSCEIQAREAIRWAVDKNPGSTYLRLTSISRELPFSLDKINHIFRKGVGIIFRKGGDVVIIAYGPVMLREAFLASDELLGNKIHAGVIDLPWLNIVDADWLYSVACGTRLLVTLDNHYVKGGQGEYLASVLAKSSLGDPFIVNLGIEEIPVCGTNREVLGYHKLDAKSIAKRIKEEL